MKILESEAEYHKRLLADDELRVHLGDTWPLIQAKLAELERRNVQRMQSLIERIEALENQGRKW